MNIKKEEIAGERRRRQERAVVGFGGDQFRSAARGGRKLGNGRISGGAGLRREKEGKRERGERFESFIWEIKNVRKQRRWVFIR